MREAAEEGANERKTEVFGAWNYGDKISIKIWDWSYWGKIYIWDFAMEVLSGVQMKEITAKVAHETKWVALKSSNLILYGGKNSNENLRWKWQEKSAFGVANEK